jgi:hypothetical protein
MNPTAHDARQGWRQQIRSDSFACFASQRNRQPPAAGTSSIATYTGIFATTIPGAFLDTE